MGAVQNDESRCNPCGVCAVGKRLPETAAISCRDVASENSFGDHSPKAEPAARMPSGVRTIRMPSATQSGFVMLQLFASDVAAIAPGAVFANKDGWSMTKPLW